MSHPSSSAPYKNDAGAGFSRHLLLCTCIDACLHRYARMAYRKLKSASSAIGVAICLLIQTRNLQDTRLQVH
jgi:hypothetical protein